MLSNFFKFFKKDKKVVKTKPLVKVQEIADGFNSQIYPNDDELPNESVLLALAKIYAKVFLSQCGTVPEFDLNQYGQIILK